MRVTFEYAGLCAGEMTGSDSPDEVRHFLQGFDFSRMGSQCGILFVCRTVALMWYHFQICQKVNYEISANFHTAFGICCCMV